MAMVGKTRKPSTKAGLPPGTLIHIGEKKRDKPKITIIDYSEDVFEKREAETAEDCIAYKDRPTITWINIDGLHDVSLIESIGKCFGLHSLLLEDILNTDQRTKMEDFGDYLFIVLKMLQYNDKEEETTAEQVSMVVGPNYVISFQENIGDVFDPIRDRIQKAKGRMRKLGPDYLAYSLMDAIVDNYFVVLEQLGEMMEDLQENLLEDPSTEALHTIHGLKRDLIYMRKSIWPLRDVVSALERSGSLLIRDSTDIYLRDLYDHTARLIDTIETYRDMTSGMLEIYVSNVSNSMNKVMKVLTLVGTIFIPLTFLAGVYGMNFKVMPELEWEYGYYVIWGVMITAAVTMLILFKVKKWL